MAFPCLTEQDILDFWQDGYVLKRKYFDEEEIELLHQALQKDETISQNIVKIQDQEGAGTELALWNHPGDDLFGAFARCERMSMGWRDS